MRRGVRSTLTTAMVLVSAVLVLTGCSGGNSSALPTPPKSSTSTASTTSASSPTPSVAAPTLPAEAEAADPDGAAAFIRYYIDTANYAYATGDLEPVRQTRSDDCAACLSLERAVQEGFAAGGRLEGGRILVTEVVVTPGDLSLGADANVVMEQAVAQRFGAGGDVVDEFPATAKAAYRFLLDYDEGWQVAQWGNR